MENKERYQLCLTREPLDGFETRSIGVVNDLETGKPVLYIVIANRLLADCKMRECMTVLGDEYQPTAACFSTELAKKLQKQRLVALFSLWHEVGHVVHKHLENKTSQEQIREERLEALKKGNACKDELEADAFAASIIGTRRAINALKRCQRERREEEKRRGVDNSPNAAIAYVEFEYRIRTLENNNE